MRPDHLKHYVVLDARERTIGSVAGVWLDEETDRPEFVSVKSGPLARAHLVPLRHARLDERRRIVRVPYPRDVVLDAPAFPRDHVLAPEDERAVLAHYQDALARGMPESAEVALHEERVRVGKRVVPAGGVRIRKVVRTEVVHPPVEVRREEIVVERIPPGELAPSEADGLPSEPFVEGEVVLAEHREEPVFSKTTEVSEGVRAHVREWVEREEVRADVRREDVEVERRPAEGRLREE